MNLLISIYLIVMISSTTSSETGHKVDKQSRQNLEQNVSKQQIRQKMSQADKRPKLTEEKLIHSEKTKETPANGNDAENHSNGKASQQGPDGKHSEADQSPEVLKPLDDMLKNVTFHRIMLSMGPCRSALYVCAYRLAECMNEHVLPKNRAMESHLQARLTRWGQAKPQEQCTNALNDCNGQLWKCRADHYGRSGAAAAIAEDVLRLRPPVPAGPHPDSARAHRLRDGQPPNAPAAGHRLMAGLQRLAALLAAGATILLMLVLRSILSRSHTTHTLRTTRSQTTSRTAATLKTASAAGLNSIDARKSD